MRAQALEGVVADVHTVDEHASVADVVEARQQSGDRRLAASGTPHQGHGLSRLQRQVETLQDGRRTRVAEGHVLELDLTPRLLPLDRARGVLDLGLLVEKLVDPGRGGRGALRHHQHEGEHAEGALQAQDVRVEEQQRADRDRSAHREVAAVEQHQGTADPRQVLHRGREPRANPDLHHGGGATALGSAR